MAKNYDQRIGKKVSFHATRIMVGNPVTGIVKSEDKEWIEVELDHQIAGLVNVWDKCERKQFRKDLINGLIKTIE